MDETYTGSPTMVGTHDSPNYSNQTWNATGNGTITTRTDGPMPAQKAWRFPLSTNTLNSKYLRNNATGSSADIQLIADNSYSIGFWFKVDAFPSSTVAVPFHIVRPTTRGYGFAAFYDNDSNSATYQQNVLFITIATGTTARVASGLLTDTWYYVALRRSGADAYVYLNGTQVWSNTALTVNTTATLTGIDFGNTATLYTQNADISSFYIAPYSTIGATEISEIWNSAAPVNVTYTSGTLTASSEFVDPIYSTNANININPSTASAEILHPVISTTIGDHTEITTHFVGSAEFIQPVVITGEHINFIVTETLNASVELINNVDISTGSNVSYSSVELTASAEFVEPSVSRVPMIASALMVNPTIFVTPSYFKMIIEDNPVFYTNLDQTTITNYGSWGINDNELVGNTVTKEVTSPAKMAPVGEGDSWKFTGTSSAAQNYIRVSGPDITTMADFINGDFAVEYWFYKTNTDNGGVGLNIGNLIRLFYTDDSASYANEKSFNLRIRQVTSLGSNDYVNLTDNIKKGTANAVIDNAWNHVLLQSTGSRIQVWVNGSLIISQTFTPSNWYNHLTAQQRYIYVQSSQWDNTAVDDATISYNALVDEIAFYDDNLTNSEIIDHFSFINNLDPNNEFIAVPFYANTETVNHQFLIVSNANPVATPITASANFVMPSILTATNINYSASALTASALNTDVIVYYGRTMLVDPAIASAESKEGFALNTTYSDYIQANITPYRYVTFDTATPYADFGTDADYSVAATVVGGTIINPDFGINGKSAKTAGTSYITDGVILKESEHDDNWGTGNNSWHSSFWMERATDDASTTGLRVLWNLNGHNDNQNIILYHYQNKLHLQINNQVGAPITITSANNVNIFDYTRHNIVINWHHNNNNNTATVYVDANIVLTQNVSTYQVNTINNPTHVGPNDEANNFARLGIGCLITSFAYTALPVVPTNTKLIIDEVYWDKDQILQTEVTNIFNVMPDKTNTNNATVAFTASAEMSMPAIITNANLSAAPATASGQFVHPSLYLVRLVNVAANVMGASALMAEATGFVPVNIVSDVMVASAAFNTSLVATTVPGPTMYASAKLTEGHGMIYYTGKTGAGDKILFKFNIIPSSYIRYLISKSYENRIPNYKEIK